MADNPALLNYVRAAARTGRATVPAAKTLPGESTQRFATAWGKRHGKELHGVKLPNGDVLFYTGPRRDPRVFTGPQVKVRPACDCGRPVGDHKISGDPICDECYRIHRDICENDFRYHFGVAGYARRGDTACKPTS